jgi:uncharacterized membrane protein YeaQ/YmgE (transglycosylase-associated protein family)
MAAGRERAQWSALAKRGVACGHPLRRFLQRLVHALLYDDTRSHPFIGGGAMGIVAWLVLGLIAGAIAKALMPGPDPGGIIVTMLIGIVGAFLGGFLGAMISGIGLTGFSLWSILLAIVGSIILLWIYRASTRSRRTTV